MKRALIVDDSKSARVVLSRVLEKLELAVDTTDSAESALHYLRENRPDVIFMDHMMSGMDGLQAVRAIKSDPSTASIPIMMYTSQDGEVYAGEARALGAAGVLPKLMGPSDISRVLDQLEILRDPRESRIVGFEQVQLPPVGADSAAHSAAGPDTAVAASPAATAPVEPVAAPAAVPGFTLAQLREAIAPLLREQGTDLRRFVVAALETFSSRVVTDVTGQVDAASLRAANAAVAAIPPPVVVPPPPAPPEPIVERPPQALRGIAVAAALIALGCGAMAWQQHGALAAVRSDSEAQRRELIAVRQELAGARAAGAAAVTAGARLLVPYGEVPLSGDRLAALGKLLADLEQRGSAASVTVVTAAGEYCLTGNPAEGYAPAPGEMPANRCDMIGNPFDEAMRPEQREPAAASAMAATALAHPQGAIEVKFVHASRQQSPSGYPVATEVSAAQWNTAAGNHNFVEFTVEPRQPSP